MDSDWFILSRTCPSSAIVTHTCPFTHLSFTYLSFHTPVLSRTWLHALVQVSRTCPFTHLGFTSLTLLPSSFILSNPSFISTSLTTSSYTIAPLSPSTSSFVPHSLLDSKRISTLAFIFVINPSLHPYCLKSHLDYLEEIYKH